MTAATVRTAAPAARVSDAVKVYGSGETEVRALDGVGVGFPAGRFTVRAPDSAGTSAFAVPPVQLAVILLVGLLVGLVGLVAVAGLRPARRARALTYCAPSPPSDHRGSVLLGPAGRRREGRPQETEFRTGHGPRAAGFFEPVRRGRPRPAAPCPSG